MEFKIELGLVDYCFVWFLNMEVVKFIEVEILLIVFFLIVKKGGFIIIFGYIFVFLFFVNYRVILDFEVV